MGRCSIANCKNYSTSTNDGRVSFHMFPKDPKIKEKWIEATGQANWYPTKYSQICSMHFDEKYFTTDKDKQRSRLDVTAIPTINVLKLVKDKTSLQVPSSGSDDDEHDDTSRTKKRKLENESQDEDEDLQEYLYHKSMQGTDDDVDDNDTTTSDIATSKSNQKQSEYDTKNPQIRKLIGKLDFAHKKLKAQKVRIRSLQQAIRRKDIKIKSLTDMLTTIKHEMMANEKSGDEVDMETYSHVTPAPQDN